MQYSYDAQGRITKLTYEDGASICYRYNRDGDLATVMDSGTGRAITYLYDLQGQLVRKTESGTGYSTYVTYTYDSSNRLAYMV